ncbi:MAG: glycosyltransferase, partial [Acidobacteria bacterium]|nr:glycosyltransferase [Acidobacteriota bacterium]
LFNRCIKDFEENIINDDFSFILFMKGNELTKDNNNVLRKRNAPLLVYLYDPLKECQIQKSGCEIADFIICVDKRDLENYKNKSIWLPLGYDDNVYYPSAEAEKDIDILISGSIGDKYAKRKRIIQTIGKSIISKKNRIFFIGSTGSSMKDYATNLGNITWVAKRVPYIILAEYQRRAKICINIHRDDSEFIVNPSFFSIPGSGSCQIAEKRKSLSEILTPNEDYIEFEEENELIEKIDELLRDNEKRLFLAQNGLKKVKENHTLKKRAEKILEIVQYLKKEQNL